MPRLELLVDKPRQTSYHSITDGQEETVMTGTRPLSGASERGQRAFASR